MYFTAFCLQLIMYVRVVIVVTSVNMYAFCLQLIMYIRVVIVVTSVNMYAFCLQLIMYIRIVIVVTSVNTLRHSTSDIILQLAINQSKNLLCHSWHAYILSYNRHDFVCYSLSYDLS